MANRLAEEMRYKKSKQQEVFLKGLPILNQARPRKATLKEFKDIAIQLAGQTSSVLHNSPAQKPNAPYQAGLVAEGWLETDYVRSDVSIDSGTPNTVQ